MYCDKKKTNQHFVLRLLIFTVSGAVEVKASFSYKVLDRVAYSLCTFL